MNVEYGILLEGTRVIIPESMHSFILDRLHYGHLGIEKTRLRAKDSGYWININRDIETTVKSCHIYQEHQPAQQHETLLPHEIPSRPWEVVGTDMFFFHDADWLIIVDYYSKFPIVRRMPRPCLSSSVVSVTKQIFSETGVPSRVVSDNDPHFASACYEDLSKKMFCPLLIQMLVLLSLYVMLSILLSILVCAAASLICACLVSGQASAPRVIAGSTVEMLVHLSLQADGKVAFEDIPVFGYAAQPAMIIRCISLSWFFSLRL